MNKLREAAHEYHDRGLPITLCPLGGKNPLGEDWTATYPGKAWQRKRWSKREIDQAFKIRGELNVGCLWGPRSKLIDFEQDSAEAKAAFAELFHGVDAPVTPTFESTRGPHRIFEYHPKLDNIGKAKIDYKGLEVLIGANGKGSQSLLPPSTTNRVTRRWLIPLDDCPPAKLPDLVIDRLCSSRSEPQSTHDYTRHVLGTPGYSCVPTADPVSAAIIRTMPITEGQRHKKLFEFARLLKGMPQFGSADRATLEPIIRLWHRAALPSITTKSFEETLIDFLEGWNKIHTPAGGTIAMLFAEAITQPLPQAAERYEADSLRWCVALCRILQMHAGEKPFFLDCRTAGRLLGIHFVLANKWLRLLCMDNVLALVERGTRNKASEYRYLGD